MKIQEIIDMKSLVIEKLYNEPENVFDFFKEKWKKLTLDEKKLLVNSMEGLIESRVFYSEDIEKSIGRFPSEAEVAKSKIAGLARIQIFDFIKREFQGLPQIGGLKCSATIGKVDIACVFKLLYDLKYLDNTLEEIENVIIQVFNFPKSSVQSYLNDNKKMKKAANDFKKLVNSSSLARD